jgi:hypothetical protein
MPGANWPTSMVSRPNMQISGVNYTEIASKLARRGRGTATKKRRLDFKPACAIYEACAMLDEMLSTEPETATRTLFG